MKSALLLTFLLSLKAFGAGYYYVNSTKTTKPFMRAAVPATSTDETFYGESMTPSGFSMVYSESYIRVMKHCFKLSTNVEKMMKRALTIENKETIKRLNCYTKGLGKDLLTYDSNGQSALEIAEENKNQVAIDYIQQL